MDAAHELLDALGGCRTVLLTGPVQPDGDSLGACLALQRILRAHHIDCSVTGEAHARYGRLPGIEGLLPDDELGHYDGVVVLDGDRHRLPPGASRAFDEARLRGIIDHHGSTRQDGYTHFWVQPRVSSTCEMLYHVFVEREEDLDSQVAHLLYAGLVFDTAAFRYTNTVPSTHAMAGHLIELGIDHAAICMDILMQRRLPGVRLLGRVLSTATVHHDGRLVLGGVRLDDLRALGAGPDDIEGIVENLVNIQGAEVGILLIERGEHTVKLSLRSRGEVDVARLAHRLHPSGGGHAKAAGVVLDTPFDVATTKILDAL